LFIPEVVNPPQQPVAQLIAQQPGLDPPRLVTTQPTVLQAIHGNSLGGIEWAVQVQAMQPPQQQLQQPSTPQQPAKKKTKKSFKPSSLNEKMKNSLSEKRGSIAKSIDKLASSIATYEANSAAIALGSASASSSMMLMMLMLQMQQQQQMKQMQYQQQMQQQEQMMQQAFMQSQMESKMNALQEIN